MTGFPVAQTVKNPPANIGDSGSIPESARYPEEGNGNPLQYFCVENPMDRGAWQVAKSQTQLERLTVLMTLTLQHSCLENPVDGGAWRAAVHGVTESRTQLSDFTFTFHFHAFGEGHGNPLQCSCLENPRDGGAWWAAVCGVAQSQTRLKRLSSSSSSSTHTI